MRSPEPRSRPKRRSIAFVRGAAVAVALGGTPLAAALGAVAALPGRVPSQTTTVTPGAAPAETLFVYGPGGPLPAMRDAAAAFGRAHAIHVAVTGGPTPQWLAKARGDADVIFSGAEHMMTDFIRQLGDSVAGGSASGDSAPGRIDPATVTPLYLRPAAILVRKGNPRAIRRFEDLLRPGLKVLVVQGAGQTGLWEDMAGRTGDIGVVRALRRNIGAFAPNSGEARRLWTDDRSFDAWLIWNIWQVANPELADVVPVAERWRIYRDAGVALTTRGRTRRHAREFLAFLQSAEGARIFARWGWVAPKGAQRQRGGSAR